MIRNKLRKVLENNKYKIEYDNERQDGFLMDSYSKSFSSVSNIKYIAFTIDAEVDEKTFLSALTFANQNIQQEYLNLKWATVYCFVFKEIPKKLMEQLQFVWKQRPKMTEVPLFIDLSRNKVYVPTQNYSVAQTNYHKVKKHL